MMQVENGEAHVAIATPATPTRKALTGKGLFPKDMVLRVGQIKRFLATSMHLQPSGVQNAFLSIAFFFIKYFSTCEH